MDPQFKKSTFSPTDNCVEVALLPNGGALIRDTKAGPTGAVQSYNPSEWGAFLAGVKAGEFDPA